MFSELDDINGDDEQLPIEDESLAAERASERMHARLDERVGLPAIPDS